MATDAIQPPLQDLESPYNASTNPYLVSTLGHLSWLAQNSSGWDKAYKQTANVNATETQYWDDVDDGSPVDGDKYNDPNDLTGTGNNEGFSPIGNDPTKFSSSYNGQGHTIDSLFIARASTDYVGLFGWIEGAEIDSIGVSNVNITGKQLVSGLVGYNYNSSTVNNSYATGSVSGYRHVGGLVGYNDNSSAVSNSSYTGSATGTYYVGGLVGSSEDSSTVSNSNAIGSVTGNSWVGGLVGRNTGSTISNSHGTGSVTGTVNYLGGLVGYNYNSSTVSNSYATGSVSGTSDGVGGLVGYNQISSTVINSYATGSVSGNNWVGGLVGSNLTSSTVSNSYATGSVTGTSDVVGGLVGQNFSSTVSNSYATGFVIGSGSFIGGMLGYNNSIVENSFWDIETSGRMSSTGGTGKTTAEMKDVDTFTDENTLGLTTAWDFETNPNDDTGNNDYWDMDLSGVINSGYPYLSWEDGDDVSLPVELTSFTAYANRSGGITLKWVTESEVENLGFIIERRNSKLETGNWKEIANYITHPELQGQGSVTYRTEYSYTDNTVEVGQTYDYRLADVSYEGVKEYHSMTVLGVTMTEAIPDKFVLYPAYPNPFNSSTTIQFELPEAVQVKLTIYDLQGREVKTLVNGLQEAGSYSVKWSSKNDNSAQLSSGIYFVVMRAKETTTSQKIILLR